MTVLSNIRDLPLLIIVFSLHKLDSHRLTLYLCKTYFIGLQELFKDLLEGVRIVTTSQCGHSLQHRTSYACK